MGKTLSEDLRVRVIASVEGGLSYRAAAARFGIGVATAVRWVRVWRDTGCMAAMPKGGDHRSHRLEAHAASIFAAVEAQKDMTLAELADLLGREHGLRCAPSTVHRFFQRHAISVKKKPRTAPNRTGRTWQRGVAPGSPFSLTSIPSGWCSSTVELRRRSTERAPRWHDCAGGRPADSDAAPRDLAPESAPDLR